MHRMIIQGPCVKDSVFSNLKAITSLVLLEEANLHFMFDGIMSNDR